MTFKPICTLDFEVLIDNSNPMCRTWKVADGLTKTWFYIYLRYCVTFTEIRWWYPYHTHFKLATLVCKIKTYTTYARFKIWHIIMKFVTIKWKKIKIIFFFVRIQLGGAVTSIFFDIWWRVDTNKLGTWKTGDRNTDRQV